jgi:hypothetical protein
MKRLIPALLLWHLLSPVWAADIRGKHFDYAVPTCQTFLGAAARMRAKKESDPVDAQYARAWGWIAGYLTAYNTNVPDTYDIIGERSAGEQLAVEAYCKEHPDHNFAQLMDARMKELYFLRLRQPASAYSAF